jgi:HRAS-like suppressor 3
VCCCGIKFRRNRDCVICSSTLDEFAPGGWVGVIPYEGYPHYGYPEVIERARNQLGDEHDYGLFNWNCQHFATWCVTGVAMSHQADKAIEVAKKVSADLGTAGLFLGSMAF